MEAGRDLRWPLGAAWTDLLCGVRGHLLTTGLHASASSSVGLTPPPLQPHFHPEAVRGTRWASLVENVNPGENWAAKAEVPPQQRELAR